MVQFILVFVGIIGLVAWMIQHPVTVAERIERTDLAAAVATTEYFDETGMVLIEKEGTDLGIPWIVYQTEGRPMVTKQLVFEGVVTCDVSAGELPCASHVATGTYPVTNEQRVRIQGWVDGEKVYVERISYL